MTAGACALLATLGQASHLDDVNGVFTDFTFDTVKFKTQTNCSLDKYPEVSLTTNRCFFFRSD